MSVIVIKRKIRRPKKGQDLLKESERHADPSFECEKPKNPLNFTRASFAQGFRTTPIMENIRLSPSHIRNLLGEPTRVCADSLEWVVKIPSKEILKIVVNGRGVAVHGFNRTETVNKWIDRLLNS